MSKKQQQKIAELNDAFRLSLTGGRVYMTSRVHKLPDKQRYALFSKIRQYNAFDKGNDPYSEHDFGSIEHEGEKYFWKIDYYDLTLSHHSPDPANSDATIRIMTIMCADEY